jgi:LysR family transcriptional regulator, hydrogen peroxide-inducible genes activator
MTLTELRYIVAAARERHFGRAAEACHVSQPTLSVAIKRLEEELDVKLFERGSTEVTTTPLGKAIVEQAQQVIEQAQGIREIARRGQDPLAGPLRLGIIYTIGPYLLPELVKHTIEHTPQMPLMLQENFTAKLLDMLRTGELDCAIMAEPFPEAGLAIAPLYDEPFVVAVPRAHRLARRKKISSEELKRETMLLLGTGHCFRDHVLEVCPEFARFSSDAEGIKKSFEGSSLETIKHMVASGMGVTVVPALSVPREPQPHVAFIAFEPPAPTRRVVLAWRRSFTRCEAIAALRKSVYTCELRGCSACPDPKPPHAGPRLSTV